MRINGLKGNGLGNFVRRVPIGRFCVAVIERFETAAGADGVDVALGENGAEPGLERAAAVKIAEEGALAARTIGETVKLGKERVGKFAGFGGSGASTENGGSSGAKVGAIGGDEIFPRGLAIFHASGGQGQILKMKRGEIFVEFFGRETPASEAFLRAAFEGRSESIEREPPAITLRFFVKNFQPCRGALWHNIHGDRTSAWLRALRGAV
jgi:hypothetical protein